MKTNPKADERNIRKLTKVSSGNSYCITLPGEVIREFGWQERQKLELDINKTKKQITITDWQE